MEDTTATVLSPVPHGHAALDHTLMGFFIQ
jgi:hypothetical protein